MTEKQQLSLEFFSPLPEVRSLNMLRLVSEPSFHTLAPSPAPLASPHYPICIGHLEWLRSRFYQSEDKGQDGRAKIEPRSLAVGESQNGPS